MRLGNALLPHKDYMLSSIAEMACSFDAATVTKVRHLNFRGSSRNPHMSRHMQIIFDIVSGSCMSIVYHPYISLLT